MVRGDRSLCRKGEVILSSIINDGYCNKEVYEGDHYLASFTFKGRHLDYVLLRPGIYKARLVSEQSASKFVSFKVIDTSSSIIVEWNTIRIHFASSNSVPHIIILCELSGNQHFVPFLKDIEVEQGYAGN